MHLLTNPHVASHHIAQQYYCSQLMVGEWTYVLQPLSPNVCAYTHTPTTILRSQQAPTVAHPRILRPPWLRSGAAVTVAVDELERKTQHIAELWVNATIHATRDSSGNAQDVFHDVPGITTHTTTYQ